MSIKYLGPIAALLVGLLCGGCGAMRADPTGAADAPGQMRTNADGSTTRGLEVNANWEGKRVLTLQIDPMGAAQAGGETIGRGVRSLSAPAYGPRVSNESAIQPSAAPTAYGLAPAAVVQQQAAECQPQQSGRYVWVPDGQ